MKEIDFYMTLPSFVADAGEYVVNETRTKGHVIIKSVKCIIQEQHSVVKTCVMLGK